ncbi:N-terminal phage integrase SAM-like domain-containing protein [Bacillus wiedmannii]|nr:N-terminal phage integrase SAM-like domain-containing protein [Bacillus wiedmannii]
MKRSVKKEAENALKKLLLEVHTETYVEPSKLLYDEYLESWFNIKKYSVGIQTAKVLRGYLNSGIIPSLGNIKLAKLTSLHMQNYVNSLRDEGLKRGIIKIIGNSLEHDVQFFLKAAQDSRYSIVLHMDIVMEYDKVNC